jgi:hypothetical protein
MMQFTLVRHSAYATAADPAFEDALEVCEIDRSQAYRVRAAGGALFATHEEAQAAIAGARGHFSSLRMNGAEVFVASAG